MNSYLIPIYYYYYYYYYYYFGETLEGIRILLLNHNKIMILNINDIIIRITNSPSSKPMGYTSTLSSYMTDKYII